MHVELELLPTLRLGAVPHFGPYSQIGPSFERLSAIGGEAGLFGDPSTLMLGIYYDDPNVTAPADLRSEAAVTLAEGVTMPDGLVERFIEAGRYVKYSHIGPYEQLPDAWGRFMAEGIPESGYELIDGAALEIYRSDMSTTPVALLHTDLLLPIR